MDGGVGWGFSGVEEDAAGLVGAFRLEIDDGVAAVEDGEGAEGFEGAGGLGEAGLALGGDAGGEAGEGGGGGGEAALGVEEANVGGIRVGGGTRGR